MDTQKGRCPVCNGAMFRGRVYVNGLRFSADLNWVSDEKITYNKKSFLTGNEKEVNERISFKLLAQSPFNSCDDATEAWYCPRCEKVFAAFDAKLKK